MFGCVFQHVRSVGFSLIRRAWEKVFTVMRRDNVACISLPAKRLLLEEKLSGLSRLMRCSRHSGVILYSYENDHCVVYTSPPPTAEPLLKEKPFGGCSCQLTPIVTLGFRTQLSSAGQQTAQLDARAGEARPRGKAGSERREACFHPGGSGFHLPRRWLEPHPV